MGKLRLRGLVARVDADGSRCPKCGAALVALKTPFHIIATMEHGTLSAWWPTLGCPGGCKDESGRPYAKRAGELARLAMRNHKFRYGLEVEVGILRYLERMQIGEIQKVLESEWFRGHGRAVFG